MREHGAPCAPYARTALGCKLLHMHALRSLLPSLVTALVTTVTSPFHAVTSPFHAVTSRFHAVTSRFHAVTSRFHAVTSRFHAVTYPYWRPANWRPASDLHYMMACKFPGCTNGGLATRPCSGDECNGVLHHFCFTEFCAKYEIEDPESSKAYCWKCTENEWADAAAQLEADNAVATDGVAVASHSPSLE
jgi:hypothetical protein